MRAAFISALIDLAERDGRIVLVVGDLGFGLVEPFAARFPDRFLNAGVAEQNMTGIAAGMALSGKVVFTYSLANFPTLRCLEQIRNDVCYHNASVKIVSVGAGLAYGALGASHHSTEDIAVMRALPGMTVVSPADPVETRLATQALAASPGPAYLRLGRSGEPAIHDNETSFHLGKAIQLTQGEDIALLATGAMVHAALLSAPVLARKGIRARVFSMHTIKPLDERAILAAASETAAILTIEEHSIIGGLGSAVAEVLAERSASHVPFKRLALPAQFVSSVGSQDFLREAYSLSVKGIVNAALQLCERARVPHHVISSNDAAFASKGSQ
jgi:transketolase